ncbi:hypothetical protein HZH66_014362 [Vespula vulgaris]|uniref:Uncharacterized protein n=1 Tax=Vespula vulgaris TaxID=7454 RepID=A0A834J3Q5_VESVU|nr:hypothetical protein HZH66_014362 [Vespula vulgaris]
MIPYEERNKVEGKITIRGKGHFVLMPKPLLLVKDVVLFFLASTITMQFPPECLNSKVVLVNLAGIFATLFIGS